MTALLPVFSGTVLIALSYLSAWIAPGSAWGAWCMVVGCAALVSGATALGASRSSVRRPVVVAMGAFLFIVIVAGFGLPLLLPAEHANAPLVLGLPIRAAIEVYGVGLLPFIVLPVLFAIEFKRGKP